MEHVREKYNKVIGMTKEAQKGRLEENKREAGEEQRKKIDGLIMKEKIVDVRSKVQKKDLVEVLNDSFFEPYAEDGPMMYFRKTNLHRVGPRTLNIEDELDVADKEEQKQ